MTTIKEKLSRGINPPNMLRSMASGYRRAALEEIERLEKVIDELRAELALEKADYAIYRDGAHIQHEKLREQIKEQQRAIEALNTGIGCATTIESIRELDRRDREIGNVGTACGEYVEPQDKYNPKPIYTSDCIRHPAAPHGVDVDASWRAGKTVCVCASWAPGEAS